MNIVVLDGYALNPGDLSWERLEAYGSLTVYDRTRPEEVPGRIQDADIILTNKCPVTRGSMEAAKNLKLISVLATGYDVVDVKAAKDMGILVCNIATYGTASVSQMAIALLLEICHHTGDHNISVQQGDWAACSDWCYWNYPLIELDGKTMGIIGFGRIGQATGRIAQSMGMKVLAYDAHPNKALESDTCRYVSLDELLSASDVVVLHCPLFQDTAGIINRDTIAKMKDGVIIINNSRGQLIVEEDLKEALESQKVYAAALDVVSSEPIQKDNVLLGVKNCLITPHISWAAKKTRQRLLNYAIDNIDAFVKGTPVNVVNR